MTNKKLLKRIMDYWEIMHSGVVVDEMYLDTYCKDVTEYLNNLDFMLPHIKDKDTDVLFVWNKKIDDTMFYFEIEVKIYESIFWRDMWDRTRVAYILKERIIYRFIDKL